MPIYFLIGSKDVFGDPEAAERLVGELPNAELEILPGAGHWPWLDDLEDPEGMVSEQTLREKILPG